MQVVVAVRKVTFALKDYNQEELQRMVDLNIIEPVENKLNESTLWLSSPNQMAN